MDAKFKRVLMGLIRAPDHRHESMTQASQCSSCGERFQEGLALYKRYRREHPEDAWQRPQYALSPELRNRFNLLVDRVQKDKLYRRHVLRLAHGTEEEKDEEIKKSNEGYYTTHYEEGGNIKKI